MKNKNKKEKCYNFLNPKVEKFIERYENISMIGFAWACYWRLSVLISIIYFCIWISLALTFLVMN